MTFDELFAEHNITSDERSALVAYLASLRMMATLRALMLHNSKIIGGTSDVSSS